MSQIMEVFAESKIRTMKSYYEKNLEKAPQGAVFRARTNDAVITAYRSGKVLFQGAKPSVEATKWSTTQNNPASKSTSKANSFKTAPSYVGFEPPSSLFSSNHIGSDESGTGDYFGPITTCAVYISMDQIKVLKEMGIQDSKAISDKTIHVLAKELVDLKIPYSLMILHNPKYNELQANGWTQGKMKTMLHHAVIEKLLQKIGNAPYEGILIDQFCNPTIYKKHLASENKALPNKSYFMTKAESYSIAVAAGSVIARASFLKEMDRLSEEVGYTLLKGASQKVDQLIARIIEEKGRAMLPRIAKVHFKNTEKAEKYI